MDTQPVSSGAPQEPSAEAVSPVRCFWAALDLGLGSLLKASFSAGQRKGSTCKTSQQGLCKLETFSAGQRKESTCKTIQQGLCKLEALKGSSRQHLQSRRLLRRRQQQLTARRGWMRWKACCGMWAAR